MIRFSLLLPALSLFALLTGADAAAPAAEAARPAETGPAVPPVKYLHPADAPLRLSGFAWYGRDREYRRLPLKTETPLRPAVDKLAWDTAGGQVAFRSDTGTLTVKVVLRDNDVMGHMAQTGSAGFDLYLGEPGKQRFCAVTRFQSGATEYTVRLFQGKPRMREFTLYFPLYSGVRELQIGVDPDARVEAPTPWTDDRPIVVYGTSITQGGCASRPGMAYTNMLSRRFNRPVINLGFSGNGKGDREVAAEIARIPNPALLILDYEANIRNAQMMAETLRPFLATLRAARPQTPILVLNKVRYAREGIDRERGNDLPRPDGIARIQQVEREICEELRGGDPNLAFASGDDLLSEDFDETSVDGVHQTDLGFYRMTEKLVPVIRPLLPEPPAAGR